MATKERRCKGHIEVPNTTGLLAVYLAGLELSAFAEPALPPPLLLGTTTVVVPTELLPAASVETTVIV